MKNFKKNGFTVLELLVSSSIIIIVFSFVLANFRTGQFSGELDVILKQITSSIASARNMSLGGQLINGSVPQNGYGIHFDDFPSSVDQYYLFAAFTDNNQSLTNSLKKFNNVEFISFCTAKEEIILEQGTCSNNLSVSCLKNQDCPSGGICHLVSLPCQSPVWQNAGDSLEVIFSLAQEVSSIPTDPEFKYVGGLIEHTRTKQRAYFYVSLLSGLVGGGSL